MIFGKRDVFLGFVIFKLYFAIKYTIVIQYIIEAGDEDEKNF